MVVVGTFCGLEKGIEGGSLRVDWRTNAGRTAY